MDSVSEKGDVFYLIHDDVRSDTFNRLLPVGSTYDVLLPVDTVRSRNKPGNTECEKLFGIIPAKFSKTSADTDLSYSKAYVRVAAVIPGTEAFKSRIGLNDWLMCVNDLEVTWDNLDSILSAIITPKQICLTLQQMLPDNKKVLLTRQQTGEERLVTPIYTEGETIPEQSDVSQLQLTVMYMTLDSSEDSSTNDLLYCYPSSTKDENKLVAVRGMFLTLSNVMSDISSHPAKISSVMCEGELVHISYTQYGRQLLVIAAPAEKITPQHLILVMENSTRCLDYMFSSLHSALSDKDNTGRVDIFFTLLSRRLLHSLPTHSAASPDTNYYIRTHLEKCYDTMTTSPVSLQLPDEAKINVDNTLSEFEAADFGDMSDDFYDMRRSYTINGTCLFYKGYLTATHLPTEDMLDIALYATLYNILIVSRLSPIGSSIIWQEVFPTRRKHTVEAKQKTDDSDLFYVEATGRYFLLIVAYRHSVMGVLLEAGGCAAKSMGNPVADTFFVNQARQTLRKLETFDFSLICEARLQTSRPPLTSLDNLQQPGVSRPSATASIAKGILTKAGNTAADLMRRAGAGTGKIKTKQFADLNSSTTSAGFMASLDRVGADVDDQSYGSGSSPPHTPNSEVPPFMRSRNMSVASTGSADSANSVNQLYNSSSRASRNTNRAVLNTDIGVSARRETNPDHASLSTPSKQNSFILTSGEENTLFNYINFDSVLGVVLSPTLDELAVSDSPEHRQLLFSFYSTCLSIRGLFQQSLDSRESQISTIQEHGVMFTIVPANSAKKSHSYWLIGRCFTQPVRREFYVCHHESVNESMVALAFKINTGALM